MPRTPRVNEPGFIHHVTTRGNNKQVIFRDSYDFRKFGKFLSEAIQQYPMVVYNYALMSNHIHLLLETKQEKSLSRGMEHAMKEYAKYFNKKYDHVGHVFQGRFKSFVIEKERYFFLCSRYIDLNPVKAGIVQEPQQYLWSGYPSLAFGKAGIIPIEHHDLYKGLGTTPEERQAAYRAIVLQSGEMNLDLETQKSGILGGASFKAFVRSKVAP